MKIKLVEMGVNIEIRITINGINFYTQKGFETKEEARQFLKEHGFENSK